MKRIFLPALLLLLLTACKRDNPSTSCLVSKVLLYDGTGALDDEATLHYTGNQVTEATYADGRYTIAYDGDRRPVRRSFFRPNSTSAFRYDSLAYGAEGSLALMERYESYVAGSQRTDSVRLYYNNGQLVEQRHYRLPPFSNGPLELLDVYRYTYTGNNITQVVQQRYSGNQPAYSITSAFAVDGLPNYYNGQGPYFYLVDPATAQGLLQTVQSVMGANNIIQVSTDLQPPVNYGITFVPNGRNQLAEVRINGTALTAYQYECR